MWSIARPGVATTTWTPRSSICSWRWIGWPPNTGTTLTPSSLPYLNIASLTCTASSRVGTSTSTDGSARLRGVDALQRRQGERRGLAGARGRLAEQVVAGDQVRDGLALDRRRLLVAEVGDRLEQLGAQPERGEPLVDRSRSPRPPLVAATRPSRPLDVDVAVDVSSDRGSLGARLGSSRSVDRSTSSSVSTVRRVDSRPVSIGSSASTNSGSTPRSTGPRRIRQRGRLGT